MKRLSAAFLLVACLLILAVPAFATVNVTANLIDLGRHDQSQNIVMRFQLMNCGNFIPKAPGASILVRMQQDFRPNGSGTVSATILGNDEIQCGTGYPTYYQVSYLLNNTTVQSAQNYKICALNTLSGCGNSGGAFNPATATPITTPPSSALVLGPRFTSQCFTSSTTWTITHNFNDRNASVTAWDSCGDSAHLIIPDVVTVTSPNVITLTFAAAQAGKAVISTAGNSTNAAIVAQGVKGDVGPAGTLANNSGFVAGGNSSVIGTFSATGAITAPQFIGVADQALIANQFAATPNKCPVGQAAQGVDQQANAVGCLDVGGSGGGGISGGGTANKVVRFTANNGATTNNVSFNIASNVANVQVNSTSGFSNGDSVTIAGNTINQPGPGAVANSAFLGDGSNIHVTVSSTSGMTTGNFVTVAGTSFCTTGAVYQSLFAGTHGPIVVLDGTHYTYPGVGFATSPPGYTATTPTFFSGCSSPTNLTGTSQIVGSGPYSLDGTYSPITVTDGTHFTVPMNLSNRGPLTASSPSGSTMGTTTNASVVVANGSIADTGTEATALVLNKIQMADAKTNCTTSGGANPCANGGEKLKQAYFDLAAAGGVIDSRGFGPTVQHIPGAIVIGSNTKPVTWLIDKNTDYQVDAIGGVCAITVSARSAIVSLGNSRTSLTGGFHAAAGSNLSAVICDATDDGGSGRVILKGFQVYTDPSATISEAAIHLTDATDPTVLDGLTLACAHNGICLRLTRTEADLYSLTVNSFNVGTPVRIECSADGAGPRNFIGGSYTHPGVNLPVFDMYNCGSGDNFYGVQAESSSTQNGNFGWLIDHTSRVHIVGPIITAGGPTTSADAIKIQQTGAGTVNSEAIVIDSLNLWAFSNFTNAINDTVNSEVLAATDYFHIDHWAATGRTSGNESFFGSLRLKGLWTAGTLGTALKGTVRWCDDCKRISDGVPAGSTVVGGGSGTAVIGDGAAWRILF